jgi:N-[(2S)-2-amino-2-carboxyethyl]-L-glutamate dehydrogenase
MTHVHELAFTVVTGAAVAEQVENDRASCMDAVRRAYLAHDSGHSTLPHSSFLRFPHAARDRIIALPAYLGGDFRLSGIKWIASYPDNVERNIARASAVIILNSTETGYPYACLEASVISATRTAASAVLGAEILLGKRRASRVGVVGAGLIARHVWHFLRDLGWEIGAYRVYDVRRSAAETLASDMSAGSTTDVAVAPTLSGAFEDCDLVVIATVAKEPHIDEPALLAHSPVVLHLSLRDLAPKLVLASQNITDDIDHAVREATSLHLTEQLVGNRDFIAGTIADLLSGRLLRDPGRPAVYAPFGLGVLDLAVGDWAYKRIAAAGGGTAIPDFFPAE